MKLKYSLAATVTVGALAMGALTGCSTAAGGSGSADTITYWASNQGPSLEADKTILTESLARYTKETGINVELEVIPWANLYTRILTAVASGEGPDVLNIGNTWAVTLQQTGAFVPFEGEALDAVGGQERFVQTSWATGGAADQAPTSIPLYGLAYSLYYSPSMFAAAGITEPPATWDEFVEDAKALTVDTDGDGAIDQYGVALAGSSISNNAHQAFSRGLQAGGSLYDADGTPTLASDEQVAGVKQWVDLMAVDKVVAPGSAEYTEGNAMVDDFINGNAAMFLDQNPVSNFESRDFTDWAIAPVPLNDLNASGDKATMSHVAGINLSVFENSDNKEAALELAAHLTSTSEQEYLAAAFGSLPVATAAYDNPTFQTEEVSVKQKILANSSLPMPLVPSEGQMETLVGTAIKDLFARAAQGQTVTEDDVRAALENANTQLTAAL